MSSSSERMSEMRIEKHLLDFARWRLSRIGQESLHFRDQDGELIRVIEGERFPGKRLK